GAHRDALLLDMVKPIEEAIAAGLFKTFLLHADERIPTYLQAISAALTAGKGCLVLVPEIYRIEPFAARVKTALGLDPLLLHSDLPRRRRLENWLEVRSAKNPVVIGTRSALFAPISNIGLVIVDEEQDDAYKQEESPRYHARD